MTPAAASSCARRRARTVGLAAAVTIAAVLGAGQSRPEGQQLEGVPGLRPTAHDPVPAELSGYWLTPAAGVPIQSELRDFARAVALLDSSADPGSVAPLLQSAALDKSPLAGQVRYFRGLIALRQDNFAAAEAAFTAVAAGPPSAIASEALLRLAETHEQQGRYDAAAAAYTRAITGKPADPDRLSHKLAVSLERAGDVAGSIAAHRRVYFDFPLSPDADASGDALERLGALDADFDGRLARERGRADALFAARRWALARTAYGRVVDLSDGDARAAAVVRAAGSDIYLKQYRSGDRLRPLAAEGPHQAEARLYLALAARGQGQMDAYERAVRELAEQFPTSPYAEEALNALATSLVVGDDDAGAAAVFGQMVRTFPTGRFAERAAWKAGWWAYRQRSMADAVQFFEIGAASFPRSDYRPSWLYWSARAKEQLGDASGASARYTLAATDYQNSYYGRMALRRMGKPSVSPSILENPALRPDAAADASPDRLAAVARPQRPGAGRDPVRPPHLGRFAGPGRDHRAGPAPRRPPAPRHQRHEARLSAVPRGRRRVAAARGDAHPLPAGLLASARGRSGQARPRQVPGRRAGRAGIDLRRPDPLVGGRRSA